MQRAVHQIDRRHFAHRNLDALNRADEQPVEVQVGDFLLIETHHQIETALILEDRTGSLARIGRADDGVQLLDVDAVAGDLRAVVLHHQLRKSHGLLHKYVRCAGDLLDEFRGFFGLGIQFGHIFAVELDGDIGLGAGHQFVESQLNGLAEVEFRAGYRIERGLHLLDHPGARRSARPLLEGFHHDHHVGILHGHRVGRNLRRADFSHDVPDFREIVHQRLLRLLRELDAPRERTSGRKGHLHGEITLVERRDKLRTQPREKQETSDKRCERHPDGRPTEPQADFQAPLVNSIQPFEETVCQRAFGADAAFEEQRSHHRHISQRQDQRPDDAEHERLGHRCEIFALDARQRQNREENDQDDDDGKGRRADYIACARNNLLVHLLRGERLAEERLAVYVGENSLHDHDRTVDDDAEVNGPEAHQVGRDIKKAHQDEGEKHGQRDDRRDDQAGADIPEKNDQYKKYDDGALDEVAYHGRNVTAHQLRPVQIGTDRNPFGQHLLDFFHAALQLLGNHVGVCTLEHHGDPAHALALAVAGHGTETLRRPEFHRSHVVDMHRNAAAVGYDDSLDILE